GAGARRPDCRRRKGAAVFGDVTHDAEPQLGCPMARVASDLAPAAETLAFPERSYKLSGKLIHQVLGSGKKEWFTTTHWSVVLRGGESSSLQADEGLEALCRTYWYPLYAYVRRQGYAPHDAQELTQEFFARLLARNSLRFVKPAKGKFRSFLLAAMNHFLADQ